MIGKLRPLTVQRQEIAELAKARDEFDEHFPQTPAQEKFCNSVDELIEKLKDLTAFEKITYNDTDWLNSLIEHQQIKLYELQNN
jgi:hypothetical protein